MADKRKGGPDAGVPSAKRKKAGNKGKWTTAHQDERAASAKPIRGTLEANGQAGVWITCARSMERKAGKEIDALYQKYAQKMYGIEPEGFESEKKESEEKDEDDEDDIEAQVKKELEQMKKKPASASSAASASSHILRYDMGLDCVVFTCLKKPLDPVAMTHHICVDTKREAEAAAAAEEEAIRSGKAATPMVRSCRYVNRLTPVSYIGKATKWGIRHAARRVLSQHFVLVPAAPDESNDDEEAAAAAAEEDETGEAKEPAGAAPSPKEEEEEEENVTLDEDKHPYSFLIRASVRRHDGLATRALVDQVAQLIDQDHHKVNLTKPDKVILVEVFKNTIGLSVVDGAWEHELRKFNITAIYNQARTDAAAAWDAKVQAEKEKAAQQTDEKDQTATE